MSDLSQLIDRTDHDALLVAVDALCARRSWDALADLARRCRAAVELGRQLWGVAMHIDYRLALEAPAAHAAAVLRPGAGRFTLGPLTEVAAGRHTWAALAPHLDDPATRATVAQERVLRGEDLEGDPVATSAPGDGLPLRLAPWEPAYPLPIYRDRRATFPAPPVLARALAAPEPLPHGTRLPPDPAADALGRVVEQWVAQSGGTVRVSTVQGDARASVGALVPAASVAAIAPEEGLAALQWAGASGGAHGRRRGGAAGRFAAWWAAAQLAGLEWPPDAGELGQAVRELDWHRWSAPDERGWVLRLAVADPVDGLAWAVDAADVDAGGSTPGEPVEAAA